MNHVAQDPVVGGNPLRPGISRRPVIDGREPARWSRRYRPVSRTQKRKKKKSPFKLPRNLTFFSVFQIWKINRPKIYRWRSTGGKRRRLKWIEFPAIRDFSDDSTIFRNEGDGINLLTRVTAFLKGCRTRDEKIKLNIDTYNLRYMKSWEWKIHLYSINRI